MKKITVFLALLLAIFAITPVSAANFYWKASTTDLNAIAAPSAGDRGIVITDAGAVSYWTYSGSAWVQANSTFTAQAANTVYAGPTNGDAAIPAFRALVEADLPALGPIFAAAASKTTPVDADEIPLSDSAASGALKALSWANIKATLNSVYDAYTILYADTDNTPAALTVGASTVVGRQSTGGIVAIAKASQAEMEAGTETALRAMTPQGIFQAIAAWMAVGHAMILDYAAGFDPSATDYKFGYDSTSNTLRMGDEDGAGYKTWAPLDDSATNGDTMKMWSADKVYDQLALKQTADSDLDSLASGITGLIKGAGNGSGYSVASAGTDYSTPSTTDTLTNKTFDAGATGNVLKQTNQIVLPYPAVCSAGAPMQTTSTANTFGQCKFGNATDKATNYAEYYLVVPADVDTSVDLTGTFKIKLGGADTGDHEYEISFDSVADSAAYVGSLGDAVSLAYTADASGADADVETAGPTTLTGWKSAITAGQLLVIRVARDGDHANDTSTVDSYSGPMVITYGSTK